MPKITSENFLDYAEAIHTYCLDWHGGQDSELYSILSRSEFKPAPLWCPSFVENENPVYHEINEDNVSDLFAELTEFLKTRRGGV